MRTLGRHTCGVLVGAMVAFTIYFATGVVWLVWSQRAKPNLAARVAYRFSSQVVRWYEGPIKWTAAHFRAEYVKRDRERMDNPHLRDSLKREDFQGIRGQNFWTIPWTILYGAALYVLHALRRKLTKGKRGANHTPDGICQPADGLPKPSV